jgi:hypothetical protein
MTDLTHAIQFFQTAFTILMGLALGEAFKQLVPDGDASIRSDRLPLLFAFLFMIFPFFHGMSRYFYTTYLTHPNAELATVAARVMFDGLMFLWLAALFFGMSRSLSPTHWTRFYGFLLGLLAVDSAWTVISLVMFDAPILPWFVLDVVLAMILVAVLWWKRAERHPANNKVAPRAPLYFCALATLSTTIAGYVWMRDFYFP